MPRKHATTQAGATQTHHTQTHTHTHTHTCAEAPGHAATPNPTCACSSFSTRLAFATPMLACRASSVALSSCCSRELSSAQNASAAQHGQGIHIIYTVHSQTIRTICDIITMQQSGARHAARWLPTGNGGRLCMWQAGGRTGGRAGGGAPASTAGGAPGLRASSAPAAGPDMRSTAASNWACGGGGVRRGEATQRGMGWGGMGWDGMGWAGLGWAGRGGEGRGVAGRKGEEGRRGWPGTPPHIHSRT